MGGAGEW
jgi:hypothetical protein